MTPIRNIDEQILPNPDLEVTQPTNWSDGPPIFQLPDEAHLLRERDFFDEPQEEEENENWFGEPEVMRYSWRFLSLVNPLECFY